MRNIFLFIILTYFSPLLAHSLPNNVISDCNLPAPTNLQAVETGPSYAIMAWDAVPGAAGYLVSWFNASGAQINADTTLDTEFEVQGLEPGETYNFRVAAVCVSGEPSAIYAPVIVVPIVTELVISSDNPLGNLNLVCEKDINPVAECLVDFNISTTFIGRIKIIELNQVYYFRARYFNYGGNVDNSKIVLDLVKPNYYPETPIDKPGLLTEYGAPIGPIYQFGSARSKNIPRFEIRISKLTNLTYKINVKDFFGNNNAEFTLSYNKIPSHEMSIKQEITDEEFSSFSVEDNFINNENLVKEIRVIDMNGRLIKEISSKNEVFSIKKDLSDLPTGLYMINTYLGNKYNSKILFHSQN